MRTSGRRWLLYLGGGVLALWLLAALGSLWLARADAQNGVDRLEDARDVLTPGGLAHGDGVDILEQAGDDFDSANSKVSSPLMLPLRVLPVIGRQVGAVDEMTGAATDVVDAGVDAINDAQQVLEDRKPDGNDRVELSTQLGAIADRSSARLADVDLPSGSALFAPLRDARNRFDDELTKLRTASARAHEGAVAFSRFLKGPSTYLVLAANNNEMRVGSGTFLSAGLLTVRDGDFDMGDFNPTRDYNLAPGVVPATGDFGKRWGWLRPTEEWRDLGASPRFPTQAKLAAQMWKASTGQTVDGVMVIDPVALRALLRVTGPVVVDGQRYGERNVLDAIYVRQYLGVEGFPEQEDRRDRLSGIAKAAINALDDGGWEAADLVDALHDASEGRHILMWSRDSKQQAGWEAAAAAGQLQPDSLLLGVYNSGGNKLDRYLQTSAAIETEPAPNEATEVRVRVTLENTTPKNLPQYIVGPYPRASGAAEGRYQGYLTFEFPQYTQKYYVTGDFAEKVNPLTAGSDGKAFVTAAYVELDRGEEQTLVAHFILPKGIDQFRVEPSARYPLVNWQFRHDEWKDTAAESVSW